MIVQTLTMPRLGETMEEGVIVGWMVEPGKPFKRGDPILELETDKTVVEFPALGDGVLQEVLVGPGDRVPVGTPIARATLGNTAEWADAVQTDAAAAPAPASAPAAAGLNILTMPRLGETMEEGVVVQWLVAEGALYGRGDAILEIETDKTVAEVPALYEGRVVRILAQPGDRITVGLPIAEVEGQVEAAEIVPATPVAAVVTAALPATAAPSISTSDARLRATPLARKIARQNNVSLHNLQGTGRRGRIERADVERAAMPVVDVDVEGKGGRLHLLIHGFAGDRSAWATTAAALRRAGHRTAVFDLPGHGSNDAQASDLNALTDAAMAVANGLPGPLVLVGHSMGAAVAVAVSARLGAKVSGVVLITPAGCGPQIGAEFVHGMAAATTAGEVGHLLRLLGPKGGAVSDSVLAQMAAQTARGRLKPLATALASPEGRQRIDLIRMLEALPEGLPIRALFGRDDPIVSARDAMNLPARVAVHFLPTGHMPQWDATREVVELILKGSRDE
ncbi:acetoin dehydrogenase dihydrolipoyllysine-residue acetyltransferase subunit [Cypionkella aquatica]|uniref:Acetoin dehydrogenase dihydrolipoyllysine-residue acetyltransferase subunit n=1 Tax=Cypionkella aquatica TaxID=1756042 RepID=A0AA37U284_9RHOB|nr:alpha/beta fold hydrolase [Cypionkella aquatica]GLS87151.1 acetoin dehydrogenase dihydrolipoyllysine-residue acetyltransferase subunit [Cypionkella aquatica]